MSKLRPRLCLWNRELGERNAIYSSDLSGKQRMILRVPIDLTLHDLFPGGRALLAGDSTRGETFGVAPGETKERNLQHLVFPPSAIFRRMENYSR